MKTTIVPRFGLFFLVLLGGAMLLHAGPEGRVTADPTYQDGGNDATIIAVPFNTSIPVIISSPAYLSGITPKPEVWRHRQIVNCSNGKLLLLPNNSSYGAFASTVGVVISSDTTGGFAGEVYNVPHQGYVYGVWSAGTTQGGACGEETYWNEKKRRISQ